MEWHWVFLWQSKSTEASALCWKYLSYLLKEAWKLSVLSQSTEKNLLISCSIYSLQQYASVSVGILTTKQNTNQNQLSTQWNWAWVFLYSTWVPVDSRKVASTIFNAWPTKGHFLCLYIPNCFLWNKRSQWTHLLNHWLLLIKVTPDLQVSTDQVCPHRLVGFDWQTHHRTKRLVAPMCIVIVAPIYSTYVYSYPHLC